MKYYIKADRNVRIFVEDIITLAWYSSKNLPTLFFVLNKL